MGSWARALAGVALAALCTAGPARAADAIRIGWTAWSDAEFVTKLAARVLEERLGREVELVQTDIAPQYQGIAAGSIDVMLMAWLPDTHARYMDKVGADVVDLGILYDHARLGWIVPDYVPRDRITSIGDLKDPAVRERLGGEIVGIDPGAGLTRFSREAIDAYGLDGYDLRISSGAAMTEALREAIEQREWIVVTGWSPHWMFGAWDLRYLEDPKGALGDWERVHAIARPGFYQEEVEAASLLGRMWIPIEELQSAMHYAREHSYDEAVTRYLDRHAARVDYWVTGELPD